MAEKLTPYKSSDYLHTGEDVKTYLEAAAECVHEDLKQSVPWEKAAEILLSAAETAGQVVDKLTARIAALELVVSGSAEGVNALSIENNTLRKVIADSDLACIYCGLAKAQLAECAHGFPGCGRGDDMLWEPPANVCKTLGAKDAS